MNHQAHHYTFPTTIMSSMAPVDTSQYPAARQTSRVSSSSTTEFRGSTNPDEDWTKISDLAERRRIQNRIAQRNYRKKLKRRLEDLERRAASRSLSPNGEDTDGRSTRESSAEQALVSSPPLTGLMDNSEHDHRGVYLPPLGSYTTSSSSSAYPTQYRSAASSNNSNSYSSSSPVPYYPSAAGMSSESSLDYHSSNSQYIYSSYSSPPAMSSVVGATCNADQSYLPLPSTKIPSTYLNDYMTPKSSSMCFDETTMTPFSLSYAGLAASPDPSFFSTQYYYDDHSSPAHSHASNSPPLMIKQEHL